MPFVKGTTAKNFTSGRFAVGGGESSVFEEFLKWKASARPAISESLSRYAMKNGTEAFAEGFATIVHNPAFAAQNPYTKSMLQFLEDIGTASNWNWVKSPASSLGFRPPVVGAAI